MGTDVERQRLQASSIGAANTPEFSYVKQLRKLYARRRFCEVVACALGFIGIILMLVENEILMSDISTRHPSRYPRDTELVMLKAVISVTTALLVVVIVWQYATRTAIRKMQNTIPSTTNFFAAQYPWILLEMLLCGFHVPVGVRFDIPITQFYSSLSQSGRTSCPENDAYELVQRGDECLLVYSYPVEALGVFMVVRMYLIARYLRSSSSLYSQWVAFVGSLNDINAMKPFFHFKALFKIRPLHLLIPLTLLNTFLAAAIIRILEHPVQASFSNYWKAVWLTAVTMTATGFGDYFPVTFLGRVFTIFSAMFGGVLLIALVQSLFFGVLELSPRELKVKHLIEVESWEVDSHANAAALIQAAWRYYREYTPQLLSRVYTYARRARALRNSRPEITLSLEEQVSELEHTLLSRMQTMEQEQEEVLKRIQEKARMLSVLKTQLEARKG